MKYIISSLLITSGLVFLGLSQRYDYNQSKAFYRIDRLTGEVKECLYMRNEKKNSCLLMVEGTGIFKILSHDGLE